MFSDHNTELVGFAPAHVEDRVLSESSTQTAARSTEDEETQTSTSQSLKIQTESLKEASSLPEFDAVKLSNFLNKIYPQLIDELDKNGFPNIQENESYDDVNVTKLHVVSPPTDKHLKVSSVSWSCTGMTLAISHCEVTHEGWCTHDSEINFYNTSKENFSSIPPFYKVNTTSCVTCIAHHPWEPSVLAAGLYNGEVMVWDMRHDEHVLLNKKKDAEDNHSDTVTCLTWAKDATGPFLVTAGCDGRILVWKLSFSSQTLQLYKRFFISTEHTLSKLTSVNGGLEIRCISFWPEIENEFVAAVDGGGVLCCSLVATNNIPSLPDFQDPVVFKCQPHKALVTCVDCSPNKNLFVTCGTDSEIHVYKYRQPEIIHTIHTDYALLGVAWADISNVVITWGLSSEVECYRITTEEKLPYHSFRNEESENTVVKHNRQRKGLIAVGGSSGTVSIWMLPMSA